MATTKTKAGSASLLKLLIMLDDKRNHSTKRSHSDSEADSNDSSPEEPSEPPEAPPPPPPPPKKARILPPAISTLDELCSFAAAVDPEMDYGFNADRLPIILPALRRLQSMHGMLSVKDTVTKQVLYLLQGFHTDSDFLHTVITGKPGTGKTELSKILADIYAGLGFLESSRVTTARPSEFISQWIGGSTQRANEIITGALGGVLLIDEAYALGRREGEKDAFSKEILNVLNQYLSEYRHKFVCIIAGYKSDLDETFFSVNKGLTRRFPWRYDIEDYSVHETVSIFERQLSDNKWQATPSAMEYLRSQLSDDKISFDNFGGDTEVFFTKCKLAHAMRCLGHDKTFELSLEDVKGGVQMFALGSPLKSTREDEFWKNYYKNWYN